MAAEFAATDAPKSPTCFKISRVLITTLLLLAIILPVFMWISSWPTDSSGHEKDTAALQLAFSLEAAVINFQSEFDKLPVSQVMTNTAVDVSLVKALLGEDRSINTNGVKFLAIREARHQKRSLDPATSQVFDSWGSGYQVFLDTDHNGTITVTRGSKTDILKDRVAAVFSPGPDKTPGTSDDVITWQTNN